MDIRLIDEPSEGWEHPCSVQIPARRNALQRTVAVIGVVFAPLSMGIAHAQVSLLAVMQDSAVVFRADRQTDVKAATVRSWNEFRPVATFYDRASVTSTEARSAALQTSSGRRERSIGRKIAGGAIGAVGGFFAGGFLGAAIEGDRCECDDPGFVGFWIGAPTGSAIGAVLGVKFF